MEEYKSFYDYQSLETYLMNKKELSASFSKNNYYLSNDKLNHIFDDLPNDYINKINSKGNFDKNKTFSYEKTQSDRRLSYTYNNQIINSKIYELLTTSGYILNDSIKKIDLYFIGNKKLLLLFPNKIDIERDIDQIGFINTKGIFIAEYLMESYQKTSIDLFCLNSFLRKKLINLNFQIPE